MAVPTRGEVSSAPDALSPYHVTGPAGHVVAEEDEEISVEICWRLCGGKAVCCWDRAWPRWPLCKPDSPRSPE